MIAAHISGPRQPTITATSAAQSTGTPGGHERREHERDGHRADRRRSTSAASASAARAARRTRRRRPRRGRTPTGSSSVCAASAPTSVARFHSTNTERPVGVEAEPGRAVGVLRDRHRGRLVDHELRGRGLPPPAHAQQRRQAQPVQRVAAPEQDRGRRAGGAAPAVAHRADERELRTAREHQHRQRARLQHREPARGRERAERESVRAGRDADTERVADDARVRATSQGSSSLTRAVLPVRRPAGLLLLLVVVEALAVLRPSRSALTMRLSSGAGA